MAGYSVSDEAFIRRGRGGFAGGGGGGVGSGSSALLFPKNVSGSDTGAPYGVIEFQNSQSSGLPIWGASNAGMTMIRKIKVTSPDQTGYYAQFWMAQGSFTGGNYHGCHPYPQNQSNSGTTHWWEIACESADFIDFQGNQPGSPNNPQVVNAGSTLTQIYIVTRSGANSKTLTFYPDASDTSSPHFIQRNATTAGYGEGNPSIRVVIGDSPWFASFQHERFGGTKDAIKIFNEPLTLSDALSEAANFGALTTSAGAAAIWWGKNGFNTVDDLTCSYGTGRSFTRTDSSNVLSTTTRL